MRLRLQSSYRKDAESATNYPSDPGLPGRGALIGWRCRKPAERVQLTRVMDSAGRPWLGVMILEPIGAGGVSMVRRFLAELGADYEPTESDEAA
jgi:hypothetical protein